VSRARESYVHPVTGAGEPRAAWREVWPFRLLALLVILAIAFGAYYLIFHLHITGAGNSQG